MEENHVVRAVRSAIAGCAATLCTVLVTSTLVFAQASTTATIRGTIQDSSGAVLPGATVTLTNEGTKAVQTTVSDDRGQYLFAGLFPASYDLKVELSGFKSYERKGIALSPNDTRGQQSDRKSTRLNSSHPSISYA